MHSRITYQSVSQMGQLGKKCLRAFIALLILLSPLLIFDVKAQTASDLGLGVIRIMPDGTVEGTDKIQQSGNVYTLTDDISVQLNNTFGLELKPCLLIMKDNIVVDGAGHTISSNGTGLGIYARGVQGVTIKNFVIRGFVLGISSYVMDPGTPIELLYKKTSNNQIINNDIEVVNSQTPYSSMSMGIFVEFSEDILVSGNTIKAEDSTKGLYVGPTCNRTTITNNNFIGCGLDLYTLKEKIISGNTIDDKPVVFLSGKSSEVVDFGEQVFIYNCEGITVKNIRPKNDYRRTVQLEETTHSVVTDCQGIISLTNCSNNFVYGNQAKNIALFSSNYNQVYENNLSEGYIIYPRASSETDYGRRCIDLSASSYNDIYNNTLQDSNRGIHLGEPEGASQYNNIFLNSISNVGTGILLSYSPQNYVYSNNIWNCSLGISVSVSNDVIATQNNITDCGLALSVIGSNNQFYHNNFVNNTNQVTVEDQRLFDSIIILAYSVNNTFDIGYPAGGNYWSNFQGVDSNGDNISETPYIINSNNTDNYPLMQPNNSSNFISPRPPSNETPDTIVPELQTWLILPLIIIMSLAIMSTKLRKRGSN